MKRWKNGIVLATAALGLLGILFVLLNPSWPYQRRYFEESKRFRQLGVLAGEMVRDRAPGVVLGKDGEPCIESFPAFYEYVKEKRPSWVADPSAPNPFPGILPEARYGQLNRKAISGNDCLFWSETKHPMHVKEIQFRLLADGTVQQ